MADQTVVVPVFGTNREMTEWTKDITTELTAGDVYFKDPDGNASFITRFNVDADTDVTFKSSATSDEVTGYFASGGWHEHKIYKITSATTTVKNIIVKAD